MTVSTTMHSSPAPVPPEAGAGRGVEVTLELPLDVREASLLDMHSVLNILGVIQFELAGLMERIGAGEEVVALVDHVAEAAGFLRSPAKAIGLVRSADQFAQGLDARLRAIQDRLGLGEDRDFARTRANMAAICRILGIRAEEILRRSEHPGRWERFDNRDLRESLYDVFRAIERNAGHAYRIVFTAPPREANWYLMRLDIETEDGTSVLLPPVLVDVMRDLMANARKYTAPGGTITARIREDAGFLTFSICDNGRGIPPAEIPAVVQFGVRGSNVRDRPTRGGGFGLTKAYYVTRMFNGRMWILSPVADGQGTEITLRIPRRPGPDSA